MSDLTEATTRLAAAKAAYDKALTGARVSYGDKMITRQNIDVLRNEITYWQRVVDNLTASAAGTTTPSVVLPKWT